VLKVVTSAVFVAACVSQEPKPEPMPLEVFPWAPRYELRWLHPTLIAKVNGDSRQPIDCTPELCNFFTRDTVGWVEQENYWDLPLWRFAPDSHEFESSVPSTTVDDQHLRVQVPGTVIQDSTGARQPTTLVVDDAGVWRGKMTWTLVTYENEPASIEFDLQLAPR